MDENMDNWQNIEENFAKQSYSDLPTLSLTMQPSPKRLRRIKEKQHVNIEYAGLPLAGKTTEVVDNAGGLYLNKTISTLIPEFSDYSKEERKQRSLALSNDQYKCDYYLAKSKILTSKLADHFDIDLNIKLETPRVTIHERGAADLIIGELASDLLEFGRISEPADEVYPSYGKRHALRVKAFERLENVDLIIIGDVSLKQALARKSERDKNPASGTLTNKQSFKALKIAYRYLVYTLATQLSDLGIGVLVFSGDDKYENIHDIITQYLDEVFEMIQTEVA